MTFYANLTSSFLGDRIEQLDYLSPPELKISDHKPVTATFRTGVKVVDRAKHRRIYEGIMKELDRLENEFLPNVTVEPTEVILSDGVRFMEAKARFLTCANTGHVPVEFEFIQKDGCAEKFPPSSHSRETRRGGAQKKKQQPYFT